MRTLNVLLAAIALACACAVLVVRNTSEKTERDRVDATRSALVRLDQEIKFRSATSRTAPTAEVGAKVNARGWPETIDPKWFGKSPPLNELAPAGSPWVEVAPPEDQALENPPVRIALDRHTAAFWYNPALGVVRARVGSMTSDRRAIELYNQINRTTITDIVDANAAPDPASTDPQ